MEREEDRKELEKFLESMYKLYQKELDGLTQAYHSLIVDFQGLWDKYQVIHERHEQLLQRGMEVDLTDYDEDWMRIHEEKVALKEMAKSAQHLAQEIHRYSEAFRLSARQIKTIEYYCEDPPQWVQ